MGPKRTRRGEIKANDKTEERRFKEKLPKIELESDSLAADIIYVVERTVVLSKKYAEESVLKSRTKSPSHYCAQIQSKRRSRVGNLLRSTETEI